MSLQFLWHGSGIISQVLCQTLKLCQYLGLQKLSFFEDLKRATLFRAFSIDPFCHILSRISYRTLKWRTPIYRCISSWGRTIFHCFHCVNQGMISGHICGWFFLQSCCSRSLFEGGLTSGTTSRQRRSWACLCRISILKYWVRMDAFVAGLRSTCRFEGPIKAGILSFSARVLLTYFDFEITFTFRLSYVLSLGFPSLTPKPASHHSILSWESRSTPGCSTTIT